VLIPAEGRAQRFGGVWGAGPTFEWSGSTRRAERPSSKGLVGLVGASEALMSDLRATTGPDNTLKLTVTVV
jgi:hypothetical protein